MLHNEFGFLNELYCNMDNENNSDGQHAENTETLGAVLDFLQRFNIRTMSDIQNIEDVIDVRARV